MPPIFGIIHTRHGIPGREVLDDILKAADYKVPRNIITENIMNGFFGMALHVNQNKNSFFAKQDNMAIIADATLYNRRSLIQRLEKDIPENAGDAELILESYIKWGTACINFLYGDFAFVITDPLKDEIFCGRDPMGVRPLFYNIRKGLFIFASELRLVLSSFNPIPAITDEYFFNTLVTRITPKDKTPYNEIKKLPPGHFFLAERGRKSVCQYWHPYSRAAIKLSREQDYIDMFRELLVNAVQSRCETTANIGAELSGGLDSSAITGIAANINTDKKIPLTVFSNVAPAGSGLKDETDFIEKMVAFKAIDSVRADNLDGSLLSSLKDSISLQGCYPQQVFSIFNNGLYKAASEKNIEVLLSGFGGDELVSAKTGIPWNELIDKGRFGVIAGEIFHQGLSLNAFAKPGIILYKYIRSKISKGPEFDSGSFTDEILDKKFSTLPIIPEYSAKNDLRSLFSKKYRRKRRKKLSGRQIDNILQDHMPERLEYCYAAAARYGIEYRYPLLDPNLILACLAFPPWLKFHHGVNRYIFRQSIKGFVPEEIRKRDDKSDSTIPQTFHYLVNEREQILAHIKLLSEDKRLSEIFDFKKMQEWYDDLVKRAPDKMNYLMPGAFYRYIMMMEHITGSY